MKKNGVDISTVTNELGGYKQISFWMAFSKAVYKLATAFSGVICMLIFIAFVAVDYDSVAETAKYVIGSLIGCAILFLLMWFFAYLGYMLIQLLLSYFYDVKKQRIAIERLALLECGEMCENEDLKKLACESMIKNMDIKNIDFDGKVNSTERLD